MRPPTNQVDDHGHNHDGADPAHHHHPHPVATPTTQTASQAVNQAVTEAANIGAGEGAVLLDIGDGAGALILYTDPDMLGTEIEISPVGQDDRRTHVAVLARPGQDPPLHAAVYPDARRRSRAKKVPAKQNRQRDGANDDDCDHCATSSVSCRRTSTGTILTIPPRGIFRFPAVAAAAGPRGVSVGWWPAPFAGDRRKTSIVKK